MAAINKRKSDLGASVGRAVTHLSLGANATTLARVRAALPELLSAVRCAGAHELVERPALADGELEIVRCEVEPPAAAAGADAEQQA